MSTLVMSTSPVPAGVRARLPFEFVVTIELPSTLTLSTLSIVSVPKDVTVACAAVPNVPTRDVLAVSVVNVPTAGVEPPMTEPFTVPPEIVRALLTYASAITSPCHAPVPIVPSVVRLV